MTNHTDTTRSDNLAAILTEIRELRAGNAQIVAWLRTQWRTDMGEIECLDIADAIEQGDFRNG